MRRTLRLDPADQQQARIYLARSRWMFRVPALLLVPVLALTAISLFFHPPVGTSLIYQWVGLLAGAATWVVGVAYVWVYFRCKAALRVLQDEK